MSPGLLQAGVPAGRAPRHAPEGVVGLERAHRPRARRRLGPARRERAPRGRGPALLDVLVLVALVALLERLGLCREQVPLPFFYFTRIESAAVMSASDDTSQGLVLGQMAFPTPVGPRGCSSCAARRTKPAQPQP